MKFDWCVHGLHQQCASSFEKFYVDPKGKVVYTGDTIYCQCLNRGCKCYVKPAERAKPVRKKRRKS